MLVPACVFTSVPPTCRLRTQAVYSQPPSGSAYGLLFVVSNIDLKQEEEAHILFVTTSFLLADARMTETTFELLNEEGAFPRLLELIQTPKEDVDQNLHRLLMELLYEMSRIQKVSLDHLGKRENGTMRFSKMR